MDFTHMDPIVEPKKSEIISKWCQLFCPTYGGVGFMWESLRPDVDGKSAYEIYLYQKARGYIVVHEQGSLGSNKMYSSSSLPKLDIDKDLIDLHVFPKNMAWSMAFTHEMGKGGMFLGPYFIKNKKYNSLNRANEKSFSALIRGY